MSTLNVVIVNFLILIMMNLQLIKFSNDSLTYVPLISNKASTIAYVGAMYSVGTWNQKANIGHVTK